MEGKKVQIIIDDGEGGAKTQVEISKEKLNEMFFKSLFQGVLDSSTLEGEGLSEILSID